MNLKNYLIVLILISSTLSFAQKNNNASKLIPKRISFSYGFGNEQNFIFDDNDYYYKTNLVKASFYYPLNNRKYQLGLSIQPQAHFIEHQLLNKYFIQPDEENFEERRARFTKLKSMQLYGIQFELLLKKQLFKKVEALVYVAIGPATINTETERLASGFTFIENFGLGINYRINNSFFFKLKSSLNHVSNAAFKLPNSGYNSINLEIGFGIIL